MRFLLALLVFVACGCLAREQLGSLEEPRRVELVATIDALTEGVWVGTARSGATEAECEFEFRRDGTYVVRAIGEDFAAFVVVFLGVLPSDRDRADAGEERSFAGRYELTDVLQGEVVGHFLHPFGSVQLRSDITHLVVDGDELSFTRRSLGSDLLAVVSEVVLERRR